MATLILPNTIDPLTTADAAEVEQNYQVTRAFVNNDVVHRDGTKAMTGPLILVNSSPADDLHAASRGYVDAFIPIAAILPYGGTAAPAGGKWALCDGAALSTTAYPELFAVLGTRYNPSAPAGTFNLPNLKGRLPVGVDSGATRFNATGKKGGSWLVPVPEHSHTINHDHAATESTTATVPGKNSTNLGVFERAAWAGSTGIDAAIELNPHLHQIDPFTGTSGTYKKEVQVDDDPVTKTTVEHIPPYVVVNYIIRVQ